MTQPRKSNIIPFNGAFYTKDGNLHNLDGASGQSANASDLAPFTGVFIGSDGAEHDITELLDLLGTGGNDGGIGTDADLRNKVTILMGDTQHYNISSIDITNAGYGYAVGDTLTLVSNGVTFNVTVSQVGTNGDIVTINYPYIISETDFNSYPNEVVPNATSGSGINARFIIYSAYAIGDHFIYGFLGFVPDRDPLVQYTALVGYVNQIINQYFPVTTDNIADQAVTASKIDDSAIYHGDGIEITKNENGIRISAVPADYQGVTVTFINIDQNGEPI